MVFTEVSQSAAEHGPDAQDVDHTGWVASQTSRSMVVKREEMTASKVYTGISLT